MRIETWEIMQNADLDEIELQLAFQCAPLITGLKVSNLFQIDSRHYKRLCEILDKSNFSFCGLGGRNGSVSLLIYQKRMAGAVFTARGGADIDASFGL